MYIIDNLIKAPANYELFFSEIRLEQLSNQFLRYSEPS